MSKHEMDTDYTFATPNTLRPDLFKTRPFPQLLSDGVGDLFHRRYWIDIQNMRLDAAALMARIQGDLNQCAPPEMATFERMRKDAAGETAEACAQMQVGDDYLVRITGPWNGPVRVIAVSEKSFSYITLQGHFEAGEIQFRIYQPFQTANTDAGEGAVTRFEIRSWHRSRDRLVDFLYAFVPVVKVSQERMWIYFCQRVLELSEGEAASDVEVRTYRVPYDGARDRRRSGKQYVPEAAPQSVSGERA